MNNRAACTFVELPVVAIVALPEPLFFPELLSTRLTAGKATLISKLRQVPIGDGNSRFFDTNGINAQ